MLRRQGQTELALKVAVRGLERHPHNADAHDLLARIAVDRGELQRAFDEWDMCLRLAPTHVGARKGMGFVCYRQGRMEEAAHYLGDAAEADPGDQSIAGALRVVREALGDRADAVGATTVGPQKAGVAPPDEHRAAPPDERMGGPHESPGAMAAPPKASAPGFPDGGPRMLFADIIGEAEQTVLLLDAEGLVLAGAYVAGDGRDVAQEVGAELSGVSDEAQRAMRHLGLGDWTSLTFETDAAVVSMAPAPGDALLLVAAERAIPLGLVRRLLDRAAERARDWIGGLA